MSLPFGTQRDEAIEAVSAALDSPPDEVTVNEQSECTPGTSARWEADNVRLSMDEAGNLASAFFRLSSGQWMVSTRQRPLESCGTHSRKFPWNIVRPNLTLVSMRTRIDGRFKAPRPTCPAT